jgi:hypothetical protein
MLPNFRASGQLESKTHPSRPYQANKADSVPAQKIVAAACDLVSFLPVASFASETNLNTENINVLEIPCVDGDLPALLPRVLGLYHGFWSSFFPACFHSSGPY